MAKEIRFTSKLHQEEEEHAAPWVEWIHAELRQKYERLMSAGAKFSMQLIGLIAADIVAKSNHPVYNASYKDVTSRMPNQKISVKVTQTWFVQAFMERYDRRSRVNGCKLRMSPKAEEFIEKTVAFHL